MWGTLQGRHTTLKPICLICCMGCLCWVRPALIYAQTIFKHANHMTMITSGQIMSWPDYLKTKGNVNIKLWDLCEILIVYNLLSTFQSVHMVLTVNKPDVRRFIAWIESADWNPWYYISHNPSCSIVVFVCVNYIKLHISALEVFSRNTSGVNSSTCSDWKGHSTFVNDLSITQENIDADGKVVLSHTVTDSISVTFSKHHFVLYITLVH